jgi:DNA-binding IclR family transcriptional regulator
MSPAKRTTEPENDARQESLAGRYSAPALEKGLSIMELLADHPDGLTLSQIAKALGFNVNEIFRMVVVLQARGYLNLGLNDHYQLTLKMFEVAHRNQPIKSIIASALPLMREVANRARQSCHLVVYQAGRAIVVAQVDSPERWAFGLKVGALVGLTDTASGHVLLTFRDEAERARMLAAHVKVEGEPDIETEQLIRQLDEVAARGYSRMLSRQIRGVINIAYPIFGNAGQAIASLNVPYIERIDKQVNPDLAEVQNVLAEMCVRLSTLMGYSGYSE